MITGVHTIIFSKHAEKTRAFFRDVLGMKSVDAGRGWLIFTLPPAELAAHPDDTGGKHQLYLMCDDVEKTVAQLKRKGAHFTHEIADRGWGLITAMKLPGAGELWLYQPKHPTAIGRQPRAVRKRAATARAKSRKRPSRR